MRIKQPKTASVIDAFRSKTKLRASKRVEEFFGSESKDWDGFLHQARKKAFVKAVAADSRTDTKLRQHVDQMNRLATGKTVNLVQGSADKSYRIVRKRGGGLACTCPDWRYKKSVSTSSQACKHIRKHRSQMRTPMHFFQKELSAVLDSDG